ncbi:kinase-like domain-containing protein [Irpex rosettiformis]|uniref:Kinase-like domain-containing protein n=1 Tax=Irpex rosettiformis TaxID=378272 RepID=A0ACB8U3M3_9APHY|nr:kinase-like domain-containing protein [Irpex rosettiformis]
MTLFRGCHEYLLYCRMRLTLGIKRRSAEIPDIPKPFRPPSVLMHVYPLARTELRIDPNWPIESFTAALIGIGGPIFDNIISKIRADIVSSQDDAHTRDMLRRLAAHIIQQAGVVPLDLLLFSGKLVLSKTGDANKQRKAMPVGEGSYASVYQGSYRSLRGSNQKQQKTDVEVFALKCMRFLSNHTAEDLRNQRQRMILELVNTWMLAHPYILSLKAVHFDPELSPFILVLPWMPNSNVRVRLQHYVDGRQAFTGKLHNLSNRWIGQIACGLEYVHTEGIVHGDVRGVNILVDQSDSIKIADFGLSLYAEGMSKNYASAREGNPAWTAPELFDRKTMQRLRGTREGDIYSFAMVCIELWTLTDPVIFPGEARPYRPNSPDPKCQEQMSDSLWRIVSNCWDEDPRKRFTALELRRELSAIGIAASP